MRWELVKAAWSLASRVFPGKRVYVSVPMRLEPGGEFDVISLKDGKKVGAIAYKANSSGRIVLSSGNEKAELSLPRLPRRSYKIRKQTRFPEEIQHGISRTAAKVKYKPYEKVRIVDPRSMEFGELGQVLSSASRRGNRYYLISVDGSSRPMWFAEGSLAPNMVGAVVYRP